MIVAIEEIGKSGLSRTEAIDAQALAAHLSEAGITEWRTTGDGVFEAVFDRLGNKVLMKARALVHLSTDCKRCLAPIPLELPFEFAVHFVSAASTSSAASPSAARGEPRLMADEIGTGASFDLSSADEELFDGRTIDTEELFREHLLLNLPMMGLVCSEGCKGLCSVCGEQLNERECGCDRKPMDPRWEALRAIKLDDPPKA
ncbi:MAG: DUF177 domain-containing protein [Myxococcales bacterium]|jgi:uncharacterized protein|nr:DUF177 domain-containing protein [Myxococcales bacterium]